MNELSRLLFNPVTIIAILLAVFFLTAAVLRRRTPSRAPDGPGNSAEAKPYHMANPYASPMASGMLFPQPESLPSSPPVPRPAPRTSRQFRQSVRSPVAAPPENHSIYIWE
ncbi:MAG: hypothetical protein GX803_02070 [Lentisphaerae bacterium]|jgi:hypothetical protein|nr:hypothetical protein [Lentisphaerota bacterium]